MGNVNTKMRYYANDIILYLLSMMFVAVILTNISTSLLMVVILALLLCLVVFNLRSIRATYILLILCNFLSCICTLVLYKGTGVVLIFLTLLLSCICFNSISFSQKARRRVYFVCCIGLLIFVGTASSIYREYDWLVFVDRFGNLINNNTLGILSVGLCFCLLMWNDLRESKKLARLIAIISFAIGFFFAYQTGCRSAMMVLLTYFVLHLITKKKLSSQLFRKITIFMLILSLLFTFFYVALYFIWPNVTILGKALFSGREAIWVEAFKQIKISPILGTGTSYVTAGFESMHNMLLGIWKNIGLIPTISIVFSFAIGGRTLISRKQQIMLLSVLIFAFFESFMMDVRFLLLFAFLMLGTRDDNVIEKME